MTVYPNVSQKSNLLTVVFAHHAKERKRPLDVVLDFDQFGSVTGVEIISLFTFMGSNSLGVIRQVVSTAGDPPRYSYDKQSDCFYLRLENGRSFDQKAVLSSAFVDEAGQILGLQATW